MGLKYDLLGFDSASEYGRALCAVPRTAPKRFFHRQSAAMQMESKAESKGELKQVLTAWDLICLGIGMMLGAGVFVTTGFVAATMAGPAVVLSYAVAGASALLSSLCYAEFAAGMPLVGGAYTYVSAVFGEYFAWITVANLILEYILANAAAIRGFAPYFATLCNQPSDRFIIMWQGYKVDWWAFAWCMFLTFLLMLGTKESSRFNVVITIAHVVLVIFIIIAGFVKASPANAQPFFPPEFGVRGVFNGAALVFFSYIGFDAVATSAEEVKNPKRDLPLGILGALGVVTVLYMLMAAALVLLVPLSALDQTAPFSAAFGTAGLHWAKYIVALGALMGIITTTLVGMYATSRIIAAVARAHMLPPGLARVHRRFGTPWVSTLLSGIAAAVMALFTSFDELAELVSISTLFAFWMVALALMWYRYYNDGADGATPSPRGHNYRVGGHLAIIVLASIAFTVCYQLLMGDWVGMVVCAVIGLGATLSLHLSCKQYNPPVSYGVPLFPWVPALSVGLNAFLLGQLKPLAYERFGIWSAFVTLFYLIYSLPAAQHKEERAALMLPAAKAVEGDLKDSDGKAVQLAPGGGKAPADATVPGGKGVEL